MTRRLLLALLVLGSAAGPAPADEVRVLEDDREVVEARVRLVEGARAEILAAYFIVGDDAASLTHMAALRRAARRGIRVRLLVDAQWNKLPQAVMAHLHEEGIELRRYHPFRLHRPGWITRRLHDKLAISDGRLLLTGGRNIESPYFGLGRQIRRRDYVDCDVEVRGAAAAEATRYFHELWESDEVGRVRPRVSPARRAAAARALDGHEAWLVARIEEARRQGRADPPGGREVGPVRFLHDPVGRKRAGRGVSKGLFDVFAGAGETLVIESPYLVPSRALRRTLREATARGVRVRILTNSLRSTDNLWPQAGYVGKRKGLVRRGVELWEYAGPRCLHTKAAVVDDDEVVIGSYNLDPRSEHLNTELAVVIRDGQVATELRAFMDANVGNAVRIDERGWPEGASGPYPGVPRARVFKLRLLRLIAPLVKRQL